MILLHHIEMLIPIIQNVMSVYNKLIKEIIIQPAKPISHNVGNKEN